MSSLPSFLRRKGGVLHEELSDRESVRPLTCDDAAGPLPPSGEDTLGEMTASSRAIADALDCLCCCKDVVDGIFVTCLMNVAMAR